MKEIVEHVAYMKFLWAVWDSKRLSTHITGTSILNDFVVNDFNYFNDTCTLSIRRAFVCFNLEIIINAFIYLFIADEIHK